LELGLHVYSKNNIKKNKDFLLKTAFEFSKDEKQQQVEKVLLSEIISSGTKNQTKIYKFVDSSEELSDIVGLIALSASKIAIHKTSVFPCAQLDLLFINHKYRKDTYTELEDSTLGEELMQTAISLVLSLANQIGIRYITLIPLGHEEKLVNFYKKFNFDYIEKGSDFMYLNLRNVK